MLTEKEKKSLANLTENLTMPKWKFLLIYGLTFGILLAVTSSLADVFLAGVPVAEVLGKRLWINLAMVPVAGFLFAMILRWLNVKQYVKLKQKESLP
jgi:hypothetical protein